MTIPASIGRYRVERMLGQGAMGSVYLGRDLELDRAVAIKTVRDLDLEEKRLKTFLERFKNEAKAAARLSHPAIVAVYDVGEDPDVGPYLVFEYVAGSTLKQIVRGRGPLSPAAKEHEPRKRGLGRVARGAGEALGTLPRATWSVPWWAAGSRAPRSARGDPQAHTPVRFVEVELSAVRWPAQSGRASWAAGGSRGEGGGLARWGASPWSVMACSMASGSVATSSQVVGPAHRSQTETS